MAKVKASQWAAKMHRQMLAVARTAANEVAIDANRPTAQGGRMRVDTGFLRNSQGAAIGRMPHGPSEPPRVTKDGVEMRDPMGNPSSIPAVLMRWDGTKDVYIGWSANYAKFREAHDGFMEAALAKWSVHVDQAISRLEGKG